jgi:hypothetical protein
VKGEEGRRRKSEDDQNIEYVNVWECHDETQYDVQFNIC